MIDVAVRLENVTKQYGRAQHAGFVLGPASIEIRSGAWVVFTGPSGAGKTTLLHLMGLLDRPDAGRVRMFGSDVTDDSESALSGIRRRRLGILYQQFFFIEHLPVWENVSRRLLPEGIGARDRRRKSAEVLARLGLADCLDRRPRSLSGGEQQRVALARAVVHGPQILIADEPTSNVDAGTAMEILSFFKSLRDQGTTIIVSTHDDLLLELADHHYRMERGKILP
jgi:putative ABC transport system ATP-binding protein